MEKNKYLIKPCKKDGVISSFIKADIETPLTLKYEYKGNLIQVVLLPKNCNV